MSRTPSSWVQALNGDTDLAYQGDPATGLPHEGQPSHEHRIWRVDDVRRIAADTNEDMTFFCGGSRNVVQFLDVFDEVFVLTLDAAILTERLECRPADEFGSSPAERAFILGLHAAGLDVPADATPIDASQLPASVVDELLARAHVHRGTPDT